MKAELVRVSWLAVPSPRVESKVIWLCPSCGSAICHLGWRIFQALSNCDNGELAISFWDNGLIPLLTHSFICSCIHVFICERSSLVGESRSSLHSKFYPMGLGSVPWSHMVDSSFHLKTILTFEDPILVILNMFHPMGNTPFPFHICCWTPNRHTDFYLTLPCDIITSRCGSQIWAL